MARFKKVIARPGRYLARTLDGDRAVRNVTAKKLRRAAETGNKMLADGHLLAAPYGHEVVDPQGNKQVIPIPLHRGPDGQLLDSKLKKPALWAQADNSGFWDGFEYVENYDSKGDAFIGYIEAEGDENDPSTHAGRIGKTFRQVSPVISERWVDGFGRVYEDAPLHICVTNRAVEPNQDNFVSLGSKQDANPQLEGQELAIAMSFGEDDFIGPVVMDLDSSYREKKTAGTEPSTSKAEGKRDDTASANSEETDAKSDSNVFQHIGPEVIGKIKELLLERLELELPDDTDVTNFADRLLTVLTNIKAKQEMEDDLTDPPNGSEKLRTPVVMSLDNAQLLTDPRVSSLLKVATLNKQQELRSRVEAMQAKGQIGKAKADKFKAQIDTFAMSLDDLDAESGSAATSRLEEQIADREEDDVLVGNVTDDELPEGATKANKPGDMEQIDEVTEEQALEHLDSLGVFPQESALQLTM